MICGEGRLVDLQKPSSLPRLHTHVRRRTYVVWWQQGCQMSNKNAHSPRKRRKKYCLKKGKSLNFFFKKPYYNMCCLFRPDLANPALSSPRITPCFLFPPFSRSFSLLQGQEMREGGEGHNTWYLVDAYADIVLRYTRVTCHTKLGFGQKKNEQKGENILYRCIKKVLLSTQRIKTKIISKFFRFFSSVPS